MPVTATTPGLRTQITALGMETDEDDVERAPLEGGPCFALPNSRRWRPRTAATGTARGYRREASSEHSGVGSGRTHRQSDERGVSDEAARRGHLQLRGRRRRLIRRRIHIKRMVAGVDDRVAAKAERAAARR